MSLDLRRPEKVVLLVAAVSWFVLVIAIAVAIGGPRALVAGAGVALGSLGLASAGLLGYSAIMDRVREASADDVESV